MKRKFNIGLTLITIILLIGASIMAIYVIKASINNASNFKKVFEKAEEKYASLTEYIVYGTHFNIKGEILESMQDVESVKLVLADEEGKEKEVELNYSQDEEKIKFYTSELINEGIDLEKLEISKNYLLIKVASKQETKYYLIQNNTEFENVRYYTITKNNSNKVIDIKFKKHSEKNKTIRCMYLQVKQAKLPKEVYDIVIDAGHGGSDTGAQYGGINEADLTLEYAKKVKEKLENLGLKVKITRDGTENPETYGTQTVYDEDGRVNIVGRSKAKYVLSIHVNSITEPNSQKGVEIYAPTKMNLNLAKAFANNIVKYAETNYSDLEATYKKTDGVYVRTFLDWDIEKSIEEAQENGYDPYPISDTTPYLYMLRETGGIATEAYIDGRNKNIGTNQYYNSNIGVEAYLLELGYLNNDEEREKLKEEKEGYIKGIVETVKEEILK